MTFLPKKPRVRFSFFKKAVIGMEQNTSVKEVLERLIRIETQLEMMNRQLGESIPKISELEREVAREKESLASAHKRINGVESRYYWTIGICVTLLVGFAWVFK